MRSFLEQYGIAIFTIIILGIMVLTASGVAPSIEFLLTDKIQKFADTAGKENWNKDNNSNGTESTKSELTTLTEYTWEGSCNPKNGSDIWTDGINIYHSGKYYNSYYQYVLKNGKWETKTWNISKLGASNIWTDGTNIYYSNNNSRSGVTGNYILKNDTWEEMTWEGLNDFWGGNVWTNGDETYYSANADQYVLNGNKWEKKTS